MTTKGNCYTLLPLKITITELSVRRLYIPPPLNVMSITQSWCQDSCSWRVLLPLTITLHCGSSSWLHAEIFLTFLTVMFMRINPSVARRIDCGCPFHLCVIVEELYFNMSLNVLSPIPWPSILPVFLSSTEFKTDKSLYPSCSLIRLATSRIGTDENCAVYRKKNTIQMDNCQTLKKWICKKNATLLTL